MIVRHIYVAEKHNFYGHHGKDPSNYPMIELDEITCEKGMGIIGDRFYLVELIHVCSVVEH